MALTNLGINHDPSYLCLSTDISGNTLTGVSLIGKKVVATDTGDQYVVTASNTVYPYSLPVSTYTGVVTQNIAQDQSLASTAFDMSDYSLGFVITPSTWTAANIGFKMCDTLDGTYLIAKDKSGVPIQISGVSTGAACSYAIPTELFASKFVKLWSKHLTAGTEDNVNQAGARILKVILK